MWADDVNALAVFMFTKSSRNSLDTSTGTDEDSCDLLQTRWIKHCNYARTHNRKVSRKFPHSSSDVTLENTIAEWLMLKVILLTVFITASEKQSGATGKYSISQSSQILIYMTTVLERKKTKLDFAYEEKMHDSDIAKIRAEIAINSFLTLMNYSSQYHRSISNTDSRDSEENYVPMQKPMSSSPEPSGTNNPAPKKSLSTSSVTSDEKGEYVQIDEEKTQALQKTIQEWTKMRQSSRPSKDAKLCNKPPVDVGKSLKSYSSTTQRTSNSAEMTTDVGREGRAVETWSHEKSNLGTGKTDQQLRALVDEEEDWGVVANTHMSADSHL
ncbi:GRB2-associated-binding protein 2 [Cricetulus griseus]|nr:GRB2-associated-binding protein 2 [Cricetulus griseus]